MSPQSLLQAGRNVNKCLRGGTLRRTHYNGQTGIAADANFGEKRDLPEKGDLLPFRLRVAAAMAENLDPVAGGRGVVAHVFDNTEDRHVDLLEHGNAFADDP